MIRLLLSQVEPSQNLSLANFTSTFNQAIEDGDLNKAAQISNTILEAISQDSSLSTKEKTKVIVFKNNVYKDPLKTEKYRNRRLETFHLINVPFDWNSCGL